MTQSGIKPINGNARRKTYNDQIRKSKKISWNCPLSLYNAAVQTKVDSLGMLKKHNIKKANELFDYLIVSGIVFRNGKVIDFLMKNIQPLKDKWKQSQVARFKKDSSSPEYEKTILINFVMYDYDFKAFTEFLIEKNIKKAWIYEILFTGFINEEPCVIELIEACQNKNVRERKKTIARLTNDKWIKMLDVKDSKTLLSQLTQNYEERVFDNLLQDEIHKMKQERMKIETEEVQLDVELEQKMKELRNQRNKKIRKLIKPVPEADDIP